MNLKKAIRIACFMIVLCVLMNSIGEVFQDKWASLSNTYARIKQFYREKTPPEVVFIGSSHIHYNLNPLVMFREFGFDSYDFSSPSQDFSASKLYVEEAIKTYSPKVIAIDVLNLMFFENNEVRHRQALDQIPLSLDKIKNIRYTFKRNEELGLEIEFDSWLSYIFPIMRYHDRWEGLTASDLSWDPNGPNYHGAVHYHGYGPHYAVVQADLGHYDDPVNYNERVLEENRKLLSEIAALCEKKGVELLLIKTPSPAWRRSSHDLVASWADELGIPFLDINERAGELDIDAATDYMDTSHHLNDSGVTKTSLYLGEYLKNTYALEDHRDDPAYAFWNEDWQVYQQDRASYSLARETDWSEYVQRLQNPNYTIYIAARDNLGGASHPELTALFKEIGLSADLEGKDHWGYMAIINGGEVIFEQLSKDALAYEDNINGHHIVLVSEGYTQGNRASIQLDYSERFVNHRGIGIVVYDNVLDSVVDCVTFDLHDVGSAYR